MGDPWEIYWRDPCEIHARSRSEDLRYKIDCFWEINLNKTDIFWEIDLNKTDIFTHANTYGGVLWPHAGFFSTQKYVNMYVDIMALTRAVRGIAKSRRPHISCI